MKTKINEDIGRFEKETSITLINVLFATCPEIGEQQRINKVKDILKEYIKHPDTMLYRHEIIFILSNLILYTDQVLND